MQKLIISLLCFLLALPVFSQSKAKTQKDVEQFRYEIECAGNGQQGTYLVKAWVYSKTNKVMPEAILKAAVHGVIFKGFTGVNAGCKSQKALVTKPGAEQEHALFFEEFFKSEYAKYAQMTIGSQEILKFGKEYKVGAIVSVSKDQLRKALEAGGVLKSLNSGF